MNISRSKTNAIIMFHSSYFDIGYQPRGALRFLETEIFVASCSNGRKIICTTTRRGSRLGCTAKINPQPRGVNN